MKSKIAFLLVVIGFALIYHVDQLTGGGMMKDASRIATGMDATSVTKIMSKYRLVNVRRYLSTDIVYDFPGKENSFEIHVFTYYPVVQVGISFPSVYVYFDENNKVLFYQYERPG